MQNEFRNPVFSFLYIGSSSLKPLLGSSLPLFLTQAISKGSQYAELEAWLSRLRGDTAKSMIVLYALGNPDAMWKHDHHARCLRFIEYKKVRND